MPESKPETIPKQDIHEAAPALADWIEDELGDTELAQFLREHPEGADLLLNGEAMLPRTVFDVVEDLVEIAPELAHEFAHTLDDKDLLPELSYTQIVGNLTEEENADLYLEGKYKIARDRISLRESEEEKDENDKLYIRTSNSALQRLRAKYGLPKFTVPDEAVRFIPGRDEQFSLESGKKLVGFFSPKKQSTNFPKESIRGERLSDMLHEFTHFHSYGSFRFDRRRDGRYEVQDYRVGLAVRPRAREGTFMIPYLEALNEAVTEETANRLYRDIPQDDPELGGLSQENHAFFEQINARFGDFLEEKKLRAYWMKFGEDDNGDAVFSSSYARERNVMFDMFKKIYEKNPERFEGKSPKEGEEELFAMLQKAMFTGNILPFGRLFNETFGNGKFREFGHLQTVEEQQAFIEGL